MIRDCTGDDGKCWLLVRESSNTAWNNDYLIPIAEWGNLRVKTEYDNNSVGDTISVYTLLSCIRPDGALQLFCHYRFNGGDEFCSRYEGIDDYRVSDAVTAKIFTDLWEIGKEVYSG